MVKQEGVVGWMTGMCENTCEIRIRLEKQFLHHATPEVQDTMYRLIDSPSNEYCPFDLRNPTIKEDLTKSFHGSHNFSIKIQQKFVLIYTARCRPPHQWLGSVQVDRVYDVGCCPY